MKVNKITIINEIGTLVEYDITYMINKLYERGLINFEEPKQKFKVNQTDFILVERTKKGEIKFTITNNRKKVINDLLGLI